MRSGICPKCGSTDVRAAVSGVFNGHQGGGLSVLRGMLFTRADTDDYLCLGCGYFERYFRPGKASSWIARHWTPVPVRPRTPEHDHILQRDRPGSPEPKSEPEPDGSR